MLNSISLNKSADNIQNLFEYLNVGQLNDHILNIIKAENRTLDFHIHEYSDEMFYIIEGKMQIELSDGFIDLDKGDFIIIPKGTLHRPVCTTPVTCLLIKKIGTLTKENTGGTYTK